MHAALFALSLLLAPETPVSAPAPVPSSRISSFSAATSGRTMLAAWSELRDGNQLDVVTARLDANGVPLDAHPAPLAITPEYDYVASVLWTGSTFLTAWTSEALNTFEMSVWIAEVDEQGVVVRAPQRIGSGYLVDAATNGANVVLLASDNGDVDVRTLERGAVTHTAVLSGGEASGMQIVPTASGYAVLWVSSTNYNISRLDARGVPAGPAAPLAAVPATAFGVVIAAAGDDVYLAAGLGLPSQASLYRFSGAAAVTPIATLALPGNGLVPRDLVTDGTSLDLVVSDVFYESAWLRVSLAGAIADQRLLDEGSYRQLLEGARPFALFHNDTTPLAGRYLDTGDTARTISFASENEQAPAAASDGERALLVWSEGIPSYATTMAVLAGRDGRPLGAPFRLFDAALFGSRMAAVFDGKDYFVVHQEIGSPTIVAQTVVGTHVSRDGVPRGDRIVVSTAASYRAAPRLASDGTNVLIAWIEGPPGDPHAHVALLTPGGLAPALDLGVGRTVDVAWNGTMYAVVFDAPELHVARISRDGALLGNATIASTTLTDQWPFIAAGNDGFLAGYVALHGVVTVALDVNAQPIGGEHVVRDGSVSAPRVAFDGAAYVVTWSEDANVYAARVAQTNAIVTPRAAISATPYDDAALFPLGLGGGRTLLAYSRVVPELATHRVFTRVWAPSRGRVAAH